ncbi:hypothetical protein [uncultured Moraxella sp.]|uniref:CopG family ribbon-helix-helix protein n=1 Tax=uncultured Moraxella sp. TaxID=263769 RepID=UPI0025D6C13F|nr:hypothetical protein [uncultured Moraxella sp.]
MPIATAEKSAISLRIDTKTKQALQQLADRQNRSVHYMAVQILDQAVQEQLAYQQLLETQVMQASDKLHTHLQKGESAGLGRIDAYNKALARAKSFLANQG